MENLSSQPLFPHGDSVLTCLVTVTTANYDFNRCFDSLVAENLFKGSYYMLSILFLKKPQPALWFIKASSKYLLSQWGRVSFLNVSVFEFKNRTNVIYGLLCLTGKSLRESFKRLWVVDKEWPRWWKNTHWFYMILRLLYHFQQKFKSKFLTPQTWLYTSYF